MKELLEKILGQIKKTPSGVRAYEDLYHICLETQKTDIPLSVEYLKKLSDIIENRIPQSETDKELRSLFMLHKKVLLAAAPFDFESYLLYVEWEREPDKKFYVPRREVMHPVVQAMQDLIDDRLDLLTISMPPGTGKSTLGIFFLSWVMGRFPDSQSLASAHSGMLTRSFYDGVYQIITDSEYLWADVFPGVKMAATNSKEETIDLHKKHRFSTLTCRAINASLTGATRCDKILYADDLCSGIEEAMSKERLDKLWSAYTNDLKSRKKEGAKEIHIATRWSVHDVIGRLENQYGGDSRAKFIVLPALDADGESNFNYTYGVGFSRNYFEDMRNNLDEASFKALFMNQPIEREGLLYDVDELRRYFELPAEDPDAIIGICDTKDKGSDYAFLPAAYVYGNDYYIDDCICDNSLPNIVDARLVDILLRCKVKMCRFESNSAGGRVAEKVQNEVKKRGGITRITTKFTTANKETKIIVNSAWVKEHCLFKDDSLYKRQSDYGRICGCFISTSRQASCNYGIGTDGRISMSVEEKNRSWCSSSRENDQRAVTIECASDKTAPYAFNNAVYASLVNLCVDICQRNGKSKLLWLGDKNKTLAYAPKSDEMVLTVHRWFANKSCPGDWLYNRLGNLAAEVTKRLTGGSTDTGKVDVPSDGKTLYRVQTGAFSKRSNADAWAAKLKAAGFDTYIVQMGNLYKVQVGAYSQKSNAENMMVKLKAAGYDAFITTKSGTAAGTAKKSAAEIAKEIYNGTCSDARWSSWGNGADRVNRLKQAGYDPSEVQSEVNKLF